MASLSDYLSGEKGRELLEEVGVKVESFRLLINKECRTWSEFLAVLKPPQLNLKHIEQRMTTNLLHYRVNYMVICLVVYIGQILFHPVMLMALLSVLLFSFYTILILKKPVVLGDSITINENGVKMLTIGLSVLFLSVMGSLEHLLWASILALVICSLHMLLRPRSVTSKTNKLYEEMLIRNNGGFTTLVGLGLGSGALGGGGGGGGGSLGGGGGALGDDKDSGAGSGSGGSIGAMERGEAGSGMSPQAPLLASGLLGGPKKD